MRKALPAYANARSTLQDMAHRNKVGFWGVSGLKPAEERGGEIVGYLF